jgi:hypothetical protein
MRTMLAIIIGLIGGFVLGIALNRVISYVMNQSACLLAIATPIMDKKSKKE